MSLLKINSIDSRRAFILKAFSSCAFCGLASSGLLAAPALKVVDKNPQDDKFLSPAGMSCQDVFCFAFRDVYIPVMRNLCEMMGKEVFLDLLRQSASIVNKAILAYWEASYPEKSLQDWHRDLELSLNSDFFKNALIYEMINLTDTSFDLQITACLWAKTFREAKASDIGYSGICYGDYAMATAFNPRLKFTRDKTLMEGADCCYLKYSMEG
jgi:hypothetical protein